MGYVELLDGADGVILCLLACLLACAMLKETVAFRWRCFRCEDSLASGDA